MEIITQTQGWGLIAGFAILFMAVTILGSIGHDTKSKVGYLVAERKIGWVRGAFSIAATWIWAPALFVAAQQGYEHGWVGVFWFTLPNAGVLVLFGWFARRARQMFPDGFTLSAAAGTLYSKRVQHVYQVGLIALMVSATAVQLLAGSAVVSALSGIPFMSVSVAMSSISLAYVYWTGLRGSLVADWLQMVTMMVAGFGLAFAVAWLAGADTMLSGLAGVGRDYTSLFSGPGGALFWSFGFSSTVALMSGPFGDQSFWQRAWAVQEGGRNGGVFRSFSLGALVFATVPITMAILGVAAAGANLKPQTMQLVNLTAILNWLPVWTIVPFILFIFSGLVSTMTSQFSAMSTMFGHDFARPDAAPEGRNNAKIAMIGLAVLGILIAGIPGLTITSLWLAYGTVRACTVLPTMIMLTRKKRLSEAGAFWGIIAAWAAALPLAVWGQLFGGGTYVVVAASLSAITISAVITLVSSDVAERRNPTDTRTLAEPMPRVPEAVAV